MKSDEFYTRLYEGVMARLSDMPLEVNPYLYEKALNLDDAQNKSYRYWKNGWYLAEAYLTGFRDGHNNCNAERTELPTSLLKGILE